MSYAYLHIMPEITVISHEAMRRGRLFKNMISLSFALSNHLDSDSCKQSQESKTFTDLVNGEFVRRISFLTF